MALLDCFYYQQAITMSQTLPDFLMDCFFLVTFDNSVEFKEKKTLFALAGMGLNYNRIYDNILNVSNYFIYFLPI